MAKKIRRYSWVMVVFLPFLLGIETCGVRQFFGGGSEYGPTEPCLELIPSPTPLALAPTPAPGTGGSGEPETQVTPIIIGGIPVGLITPLPSPLNTITITTVHNSSFCLGSAVSHQSGTMVEPSGTTIMFGVSAGTMGCYRSITVDGNTIALGGPGGSSSYVLTVTGNHSVRLCVNNAMPPC